MKGLVWFGFHSVGILDKRYERAIWQNSGNVVFSCRAILASGVRISNRGELKIGNGVNITGNTSIVCHKAVTIGADCMISWDSLIMDLDFHDLYLMEDGEARPVNPPEEIQIGEHCWICCRCLVLKGVKLPPDTVVAAGSTLSAHTFSEEHTIVGNNHRILKRQIGWRK